MDKTTFDILIVGSGLFGSVMAFEAKKAGLKTLVIDRRSQIGGNCHTKTVDGVHIHMYGPHIFHTDDREIWEYMQQLGTFGYYTMNVVANYKDELYSLPFNMNTFYELWGSRTPAEAREMLERQRIVCDRPGSLEEHVLNIAGVDIYEKLVKGYTEKRWGKPCSDLPASIMRRIPLRYKFDNNFFNDIYQGVPLEGYTAIFEKLLAGSEVRLGVDYLEERDELRPLAKAVVYTGAIDEYFGYRFGPLEYRSIRYEYERHRTPNYQGCAVMNYTDSETPFLRVVEHKYLGFRDSETTIISREYAQDWKPGIEPYYPIEDDANRRTYEKYLKLAKQESDVCFCGRLGEYRYYDMQDVVGAALRKARDWFG